MFYERKNIKTNIFLNSREDVDKAKQNFQKQKYAFDEGSDDDSQSDANNSDDESSSKSASSFGDVQPKKRRAVEDQGIFF
jgi:hypothetical protein